MMTTNDKVRGGQRGYSLIEMLIAIALLGSVLVAVMTLFVFGRRNVYSGKQMTQAVAMGTQVLETVAAMDRSAIKSAFALPGTAGASVSVAGTTYANSFERSTDDVSGTTDPRGYLERWRDEMINNNRFNDGRITLVFTPTQHRTNPAAATPTMDESTVVRVRVIVSWAEGLRQRSVSLDTIKIER